MMKNKFLFSLFFLFSAKAFPQQWYSSQVQRGRDVNSVIILNPGAVVIGGGNQRNDSIQSIFTSGNQGLSWSLRTDDISSWIKSLAFIDSLNGFGVGFNGKIIKTTDGGSTWTLVNSPTYARNFNKIIFIDSITAFIAGGCEKNDSIQTILRSVDGGTTWGIVYNQFGHWLKSICFIDSVKGYAVGDSGTILKTNDGGTSWAPISSPIQRDFNALTFINDSLGYIIGGNRTNDSIRTILQTIDGGTTWSVLKDELSGWLTDIYFLNRDTGYIVGYQATLLKTIDGGQTWTQESVNGNQGDEFFNTVRFHDENFGVIGGRYGKVFVYTRSSIPQAQTMGHLVNDSTRVDLYGKVNTGSYPGQFWFIFSTDSAFSSFVQTSPQTILSDTLTPVVANAANLLPNTIYYYYIIAKTYAGTSAGERKVFYTYQGNFVLKTLSATEVANISARLNAELSGISLQVSLSFEYGISTSFGSEIPSIPDEINDTSFYHIYSILIGLQTNSLYYFRIKAVSPEGITFYGQVQQLYTGNPIPNWDFQIWNEDTIQLPYDWTIATDNFEKVSGNSGDYALKLSKDNIAFLGKLLPDGSENFLYDGMPFNARPDSIISFINYSIGAGDTAWLLLQLTNNGAIVALQFFPIAGSSGGDFERLSYKINYNNSSLVPDTLAMGIISINPFDTVEFDFSNNLLIVDEINFSPSSPPVVNSGFENWLEHRVKYPVSWGYLKYVYIDNIINGDLPMVSQTFFEEPYDYAAEIRNIESGNNRFVEASVSLKKPKQLFDGGGPFFSVSARHQTLNGYFQFYPVNGDSMEIRIEMYHRGVVVGQGSFIWADSIANFQPFNVPINYTTALVPDSGSIEVSMTTGKGPSRIIIDKLTFDGFALSVGIESPVTNSSADDDMKVYPNPAEHLIIVETTVQNKELFKIQLIYLNGEVTKELNLPASQNRIEIETTDLRSGLYILHFSSGSTIFNKKILIVN